MRATLVSLQDIAEKHGWVFTTLGEKGDTGYCFTKGPMIVKYSRLGGGSLHITWHGRYVPWSMKLEHEGKEVLSHKCTRGEYVDVLLPQVTEEVIVPKLLALYKGDVQQHSKALRTAEKKLRDILSLAAVPCPEGGTHDYTPDLEYDSSGDTVNCTKCGEPQPA